MRLDRKPGEHVAPADARRSPMTFCCYQCAAPEDAPRKRADCNGKSSPWFW